MKPFKTKSNEAFIRLFSLFERELKNYHPAFQSNAYQISYIVSRKRFSNNYRIRLILTVFRSELWKKTLTSPIELKKVLESYSRYFSIDFIHVVRKGKIENTKKRDEIVPNESISINERVLFEMLYDGIS